MGRVIALLAVIALFVGGLAVGVNAESSHGRQPTSSGPEDSFTPLSPAKLRQLARMVERTKELRIRANCPKGPLSIEKINCNLKELKKFAKATQKQLVDVDEFLQLFFKCTGFVQVTQYGDPAGTFGYVFDPGTGVTFKTTSLDITNDVTTEDFLNYYALRGTQQCVDFANQ